MGLIGGITCAVSGGYGEAQYVRYGKKSLKR